MGTVITCVVIALTSTFSPVIGGPDSPAVAVMSVLAASIATALAAKGAPTGQIVINVLVALSVSTLLTGILLYGVGALKMGQWLRFIPYPVIGGFLAASGILLVTGGMEVVTQTNLTLSPSSWQVLYSPLYAPQILIGALFAASIPVLGRLVPNYLALPIAFFGFLIVLDVSLFGFVSDETIRSAWFLPSLGELTLWWPINAMIGQQVDWGVIAQSSAEIGSLCGVMAIALLLDVSSLEVARQKTGDLDQEFRSNGLANLLASVLGGFGGSLSMNACLLLDEFGATTRWAGAIVGIVCAIILFSGTDVGSIVPKAILGGMLGLSRRGDPHRAVGSAGAKLVDGMGAHRRDDAGHHQFRLFHGRGGRRDRRLPDVRAELQPHRRDPAPPHAAGILQQCRALAGTVAAAARGGQARSRVLALRLHLLRLVQRPVRAHQADHRGAAGQAGGLCGARFQRRAGARYLGGVEPGQAAQLLRGAWRHARLLRSERIMRASFEKAGFFGSERPHQVFGSRNEAIEWCEDMLLMYHEVGDASTHSFESWLQSEFGEKVEFEKITPYMERQELKSGEFLFRQGEPSDSVVLQASGSVAITIIDEHGRPIRLRRMIGHTVVGEMGFYRGVPRTASVIAEGPTVIYRLTREAFDTMQAEDPTAAAALHKLIIRLLSDRLEFANREISALL